MISNPSANVPCTYGVLVQFGYASDSYYHMQIAFDIQTKKMHSRGKLEGKWSAWAQL